MHPPRVSLLALAALASGATFVCCADNFDAEVRLRSYGLWHCWGDLIAAFRRPAQMLRIRFQGRMSKAARSRSATYSGRMRPVAYRTISTRSPLVRPLPLRRRTLWLTAARR